MDEKITSRENAKIKYACRLASGAAFRRTEGRFLAEGRKLCPELARGAELETLFYTENALEKCPELAALPGEHYLVEDHVADKLADVGTHQGVFGVFRTPVHTLEEVRPGGRYLALERVQDPGNVGTLLRSAAAFGFDAVALSPGCADAFSQKALRASMGAAVRIPVIETGAMPQAITLLREKGITCLAAALYQSQPLSAAKAGYPGGVCVVIGSEGQGLTDETIAACNSTVRIPMTDRPGVVAEVTTIASSVGCNIQSIEIDHITEDSAVLSLVLTDEGDVGQLSVQLIGAGYAVSFSPLAAKEHTHVE